MDNFVIDKFGNCKNKFKPTKKYGKMEIYHIVDTMNENTCLLNGELIVQKLNQITNKYVHAQQEIDKLTAILEDLDIDADYYWDLKPKNDKEVKINVPVNFTIYDNMEFAIKEMVCTLKNLDGEYTYCKGRLRKIYGAILNYLTNGGITVKNNDRYNEFKCRILFSKEWKKYNVPKNWEKEPLSSKAKFNVNTRNKKAIAPRKTISGTVRQNVFMRDNYTCQICGRTVKDGVKLHLDHIIPISKGGKDTEDNLQILCSQCNSEKHNRTDLLHDKIKLKELKEIYG